MADLVSQLVTGTAEPQPNTEAQWSATADIVRVANDILDGVGVIPPTSGIENGHVVTIRPHTDLGAIVYAIAGGPYAIAAGDEKQFVYNDGEWQLVT